MESQSYTSPAMADYDVKKRRKVRTCQNCRRRKVQCDQAKPCGRCVRGGQSSTCVYLDDSVDTYTRSASEIDHSFNEAPSAGVNQATLTQASAPVGALFSRLESQERRIYSLEAELDALRNSRNTNRPQISGWPPPNGDGDKHHDNEDSFQPENRTIKGKSFKTRFYGPSFPESLIAYVPDLTTLSKEIVGEHAILIKVRQDLRAIESRLDHLRVTRLPVTKEDLEDLLPAHHEVDLFVEGYFESFGSIYSIIHRPSFHREYEEMWTSPAQTRPHFIALVLLMIAISRCLERKEPWLYLGKDSVARDTSLKSIGLCEEWLRLQSQKHVTITDFQVRFLINLAKAVTSTKFKRSWIDAVTALKHCIGAGLHTDPAMLLKQTSTLNKEMRRRIWWATAEFELQNAFNRGVPADQMALQSDTPPPNNVHDDDLDTDTESVLTSRSLSEFTDASYLTVACATYHLRHRLCTLLNSRQHIPLDEARTFTQQIETHILAISYWTENTAADIPRALLHLTLRQYLLVLHNRQLRQSSSASERDFSRMVLINTAAEILNAHSRLLSKDNHVLQLLCHDHLRSALSVCHAISAPRLGSSRIISATIDHHAEHIVNEVVEVIAGKIDLLGAGQQQLWIALVAKAFVKSHKDPRQTPTYTQDAVHKMTASYYQIMACQAHVSNTLPAIARYPLDEDATSGSVRETTEQRSQFCEGELSGMDLDTISAWTFDEWTFESEGLNAFGDVH